MKKLVFLIICALSVIRTQAQLTSLNENFNTYCAVLGENYPTYWSVSNNTPDPLITWTCGPSDGRGPSPCIKCTNNDGTTNYVDTAWLFTPQLNLSFYTGSIYLQFDTKYLSGAGRLSLLVSNNYENGWPPDTVLPNQTWYDRTSTSTPVLGNGGSSVWTTHYIDLTPYKSAPLFVAFRFTADASEPDTWYIDNVLTTQTPTDAVPVTGRNTLPLTIIGASTPGQVSLSYNIPVAATYSIELYDMVGRRVYKESIEAPAGAGTHAINGLALSYGMYLVKMSNGAVYNTAKAIIQ